MRRPLLAILAIFGLGLTQCNCEDRVRKSLADRTSVEERKAIGKDPGTSHLRESEPNDSIEDANTFRLRGELRPIRGSIESSHDVDWFGLHTEEEEPWLVRLEVHPLSTSLHPAIYLSTGESTGQEYDNFGVGKPEVVPWLRLSSTPLYFSVHGRGGTTGDYEIRVTRRLTSARLSAEPNDSTDRAIILEGASEIQGFYDRPRDRDVYRVDAEPADIFTLEVSPVPGVQQVVRWYLDEALQGPGLAIQIHEEPAVIPNLKVGAESGQAWLVMMSSGSFSHEHGYRIRLTPHPAVADITLETEPNDQRAQEIVHPVTLNGYMHQPDDVDRFLLLPADESQTEVETVEEEHAEGPAPALDSEDPVAAMERALLESAGPSEADGEVHGERIAPTLRPSQRLPRKSGAVSDSLIVVELTPLRPSDLLALSVGGQKLEASEPQRSLTFCQQALPSDGLSIQVQSVQILSEPAQPTRFHYSLTTRDLADDESMESEPNDDFESADILKEKRQGTFTSLDDTDFFVFAVDPLEDPDQFRTVTVTATPGMTTDIVMQIFDEDRASVARVHRGGVGSAERFSMELPPGIYFVQLRANAGQPCEIYSVTLEM